MRGMGWSLIIVLVAAGWLLDTIGKTAFTVVVWVIVGLVLLAQVAGLLAKMGVLRMPAPPASGQMSPQDEHRWQRSRQQRERGVAALLAAVEQRDHAAVEQLVLQENVSPYESGLFKNQRLLSAYALASEQGFDPAIRFFEAWKNHGSAARMEP